MATVDTQPQPSSTDPIRIAATPRAIPSDSPSAAHKFSGRILNVGFIFALILAAVCLASSTLYLYTFLSTTMAKIDGLLARAGTPGVTEVLIQLGINAALVSARLALLSCGVFVAMAFGFLGFGLFLIGVKGEIEASGNTETFGFKVARMSPGVFVMTATLLLVGVCVTHRTPFDYRMEQAAPSATSGERAAESVLKRLAGANPAATPHAAPAPVATPTIPAATTSGTVPTAVPPVPAANSPIPAANSPIPHKSELRPVRAATDEQLPIVR